MDTNVDTERTAAIEDRLVKHGVGDTRVRKIPGGWSVALYEKRERMRLSATPLVIGQAPTLAKAFAQALAGLGE